MIQVLYERKKLIIFVTLAVMLLGTSINAVVYYNRQTMTLTLDYMGIDKGLNPDGSRFNVYEIKSEEVLESALKKINLQGYTLDDIKNRISIESVIERNAPEKVKNASSTGREMRYIPNVFRISYSQKSKFKENHTLLLLNAIAKSYDEYFREKYTEKNNVLLLEEMDFKDYEYIEIADFYTNKVNSMIRYFQRRIDENQTFKSVETGYSFLDIITVLSNLRDVEIEKYKSYIVSASLTKNNDLYLQKLDYTIANLNKDYAKLNQGAVFTKNAMGEYDPRITGTIFIPSVDSQDKFYMNKTQTGLDYLAQDAFSTGIDAEDVQKYINHYKYLMSTFSKGKKQDADFDKNLETSKAILSDIDKSLKEISEIAYKTDNEFLEQKTRDYLKFKIPKYRLSGFINLKNMFKLGLIGFLLSCLYVISKSYIYVIKEENEIIIAALLNILKIERKRKED